MPKNKLMKYAALKGFDNVFEVPFKECSQDFHLKGRWHSSFFKNDKDVVLELGCGKGEYTIALAEKYPEYNYVGIDLKGDRIFKGAMNAQEKKLNNVAFLRTQIQFIERFFAKDEVSEIWLTFPDPQLQKPKHRKRLTAPDFINKYKNILKSGGLIHLKTDNTPLFEFTLDIIKQMKLTLLYASFDIYAESIEEEILKVQTYYESLFTAKGEKIKYLKFCL